MSVKPSVKIQKLAKSQIEIEVEISGEDMAGLRDLTLKEMAAVAAIKGFRPGKAPKDLVEKEIGGEKIDQETIQSALEKTYPQIIIDNEIEAIGRPEITIMKFAAGNPFVYKAKVSVLPEVVLPDYKKIAGETLTKERKVFSVEDKEVNDALAWLQKSRAKYVAVNRPVQKGDFVEIDFETRLAGVKIENGESKNHGLIIGEGGFMPGFEDNLVGMEVGREKEFSLKAPDDYFAKNLAGKSLDFKARLNVLQQRELPALDDDFAKGLGNFDGLEALKKNVKDGIIAEKEQKEKERARMKTIEAIAEQTNFEAPQVLIDYELEKMMSELNQSVGRLGLSFDQYLSQIKKTADELKKEMVPSAEKRVRIALVLKAIAKKENINVPENEIEAQMNETLKRYPADGGAKKNIDLEQLKDYTKGVIRNEKVFQLLEKI